MRGRSSPLRTTAGHDGDVIDRLPEDFVRIDATCPMFVTEASTTLLEAFPRWQALQSSGLQVLVATEDALEYWREAEEFPAPRSLDLDAVWKRLERGPDDGPWYPEEIAQVRAEIANLDLSPIVPKPNIDLRIVGAKYRCPVFSKIEMSGSPG